MSTIKKIKPIKGIILGFDLDQTLIDSHGLTLADLESYEKASKFIDAHINNNILERVLRRALYYRRQGQIDAIFLLTNNSDREYVTYVCRYISDRLSGVGLFGQIRSQPKGNSNIPNLGMTSGYFFDYIMVRQHSSRGGSEDPTKSLKDIKYMIDAVNDYKLVKNLKPITILSDKFLASRTYFFDDRLHHNIRDEFNEFGYPENYIQIKGPYNYPPPNEDVNKGFIYANEDLTDYSPILNIFNNIDAAEANTALKAEVASFNAPAALKPTKPLSATALAANSITMNPTTMVKGTPLNLLKARIVERQSPRILVPDLRIAGQTTQVLPPHLRLYADSGKTRSPDLSTTRPLTFARAAKTTLPPATLRNPLAKYMSNTTIGKPSGFGGKRTKKNRNKNKKKTIKRKRTV